MGTKREVVGLTPGTPQLEVPQSGEGYLLPADVEITPDRAGAAFANIPYAMVMDEPTTNLIDNPKFASNITDGWNDKGTPTNTRDTSNEFMGDGCLKIVTSGSNEGIESESITVSSSTNYVFSAWVKGEVGGENLVFGIDPDVSATVTTATLINDPGVSTDYKRYQIDFTTGASDSSVKCQIYCASTGKTIYVDGCQLEQRAANALGFTAPSAYCDGDLGAGHSWAGTANNSASSRTGGMHILAPMLADGGGGFAIRPDGTIDGYMTFRGDQGSFNSAQDDSSEPNFSYSFTHDMTTNLVSWGIEAGVVRIENEGNGIAAYISSAATTDYGMVLDVQSLTSGTGLAVFAATDMSAMISGGGKFFEFTGKEGGSAFAWAPEYQSCGNFQWVDNMRFAVFGGGGWGDLTAELDGTVGMVSGTKNVTGSGTAFLTDYEVGGPFRWEVAPGVYNEHRITAISSDTAMTTEANHTLGTTSGRDHWSRDPEYRPARVVLEDNLGDHYLTDDSPTTAGGWLYSIYPSGHTGQLHVMQSSAREDLDGPTADGDGDPLVTGKYYSDDNTSNNGTSEVDVIDGYTIPANMLTTGKVLRLTFAGDFNATSDTDTLTWKVKLGATTILTTIARQFHVDPQCTFRGTLEIYCSSGSTQESVLHISAAPTSASSTAEYIECKRQASSVDTDEDLELVLTTQASVAADINLQNFYVELI